MQLQANKNMFCKKYVNISDITYEKFQTYRVLYIYMFSPDIDITFKNVMGTFPVSWGKAILEKKFIRRQ